VRPWLCPPIGVVESDACRGSPCVQGHLFLGLFARRDWFRCFGGLPDRLGSLRRECPESPQAEPRARLGALFSHAESLAHPLGFHGFGGSFDAVPPCGAVSRWSSVVREETIGPDASFQTHALRGRRAPAYVHRSMSGGMVAFCSGFRSRERVRWAAVTSVGWSRRRALSMPRCLVRFSTRTFRGHRPLPPLFLANGVLDGSSQFVPSTRRSNVCAGVLVAPRACWTVRRNLCPRASPRHPFPAASAPLRFWTRYLVDPASSHMLVSKTKPCMSKCKLFLHCETANGSLNQLSFI
jgi:hypothetical protein